MNGKLINRFAETFQQNEARLKFGFEICYKIWDQVEINTKTKKEK